MFDWDMSLRDIFLWVVFFVFIGVAVYGSGTAIYRARGIHIVIGLAGILFAWGTWFLVLH